MTSAIRRFSVTGRARISACSASALVGAEASIVAAMTSPSTLAAIGGGEANRPVARPRLGAPWTSGPLDFRPTGGKVGTGSEFPLVVPAAKARQSSFLQFRD